MKQLRNVDKCQWKTRWQGVIGKMSLDIQKTGKVTEFESKFEEQMCESNGVLDIAGQGLADLTISQACARERRGERERETQGEGVGGRETERERERDYDETMLRRCIVTWSSERPGRIWSPRS